MNGQFGIWFVAGAVSAAALFYVATFWAPLALFLIELGDTLANLA